MSTSAAFQPWVSPVARPYPPDYVFSLPFSVVAFASWTFVFPLGSCPFLAVRLLAYRVVPVFRDQTPSGFPRFAPLRCDWGWVLSLLRGLGVPHMESVGFHALCVLSMGPTRSV
jgi:hypothetical protein